MPRERRPHGDRMGWKRGPENRLWTGLLLQRRTSCLRYHKDARRNGRRPLGDCVCVRIWGGKARRRTGRGVGELRAQGGDAAAKAVR
jgi:hypothetical protein